MTTKVKLNYYFVLITIQPSSTIPASSLLQKLYTYIVAYFHTFTNTILQVFDFSVCAEKIISSSDVIALCFKFCFDMIRESTVQIPSNQSTFIEDLDLFCHNTRNAKTCPWALLFQIAVRIIESNEIITESVLMYS